jgi:hypothetical protein
VSRGRALALLTLLVLATTVTHLAVTGLQARAHLESARSGVRALAPLLQSGQLDRARVGLRDVQADTRRARALTSGPVWRAAARIPLLGRTPGTVSDIASSADAVLRDALPLALHALGPLAPAAPSVASPESGDTDRPVLDLPAVAAAAPGLREAERRVQRARDALATRPSGLVPGPVARARREVVDELDRRLLPVLRGAATAATAAPELLGASGPRRYFLALQNTAEARGSGGLPGVYAVLVADRGRLRLERVGSDRDLQEPVGERVGSTQEHTRRYATFAAGSAWLNANLGPHFPDAARIWSQLWQRQSGQRVDGVLALDPAVLDHLLTATGPVPLPDGTVLSAGDAVPLTLSRAYALHDDDHLQRKAFLVGLVPAVLERLQAADVPAASLGRALLSAVGEGRVRLYSRHADEQRLLESSALGGALPAGPQPFAMAVVNNAFGNKLDYYLDRRVDYTLGPCTGGTRNSRVVVRLRNSAPLSLGDYVTGRIEDARRGQVHPYAHHRLLVSVFTTRGARLAGATLDGRTTSLRRSTERGHPVFDTYLELPRGAGRTLVLDLEEPVRREPALLLRQPLVRPQDGDVEASPCRAS